MVVENFFYQLHSNANIVMVDLPLREWLRLANLKPYFKYFKQTFLFGLLAGFIGLYCLYIAKLIRDVQDYQTLFTTPQAENFEVETPEMEQKKREYLWNSVVATLENQEKSLPVPKIIGIGMEHCGIDTLVQLLLPHPLVRINPVNQSMFLENINDAHIHYHMKTLPKIEAGAFLLEKKSDGFHLPPYNLPYFLKKMFPKAKLLLVLCEPSKRVIDDFIQKWTSYNNSNQLSFVEKYQSIDVFLSAYIPVIQREVGEYRKEWNAVDAEHKLYEILNLQKRHFLSSILTKSFYALHLKRWSNYFDSSNLMIVDRAELQNDPGFVIEKVQEFVKLPKLLLKSDFVKNTTTGKICYNSWKNFENLISCSRNETAPFKSYEANANSLNDLKLLFKSHNEELYNMIGKRFNW